MKLNKIILILFVFLISCKNNKADLINIKEKTNDTIKPTHLNKNSLCYKNSLNYKYKYGFVISDLYDISEEEIFDIDKDFIKDTIAILSPLTLLPSSRCEIKQDELIDNRLLLIILSNKKKFLFENVITNEMGLGTLGAELIKKENNGFILEKELGQSCHFKYEIHVKILNEKCFIENISLITSGCPYDKDRKININFSKKTFLLEKYTRKTIDSLKNINHIE